MTHPENCGACNHPMAAHRLADVAMSPTHSLVPCGDCPDGTCAAPHLDHDDG